MRIRKIIDKPVKLSRPGIEVAGGLHAVINANINSRDGGGRTTSHQVTRIVQQGGSSRVETGEDGTTEVDHD